MAKHRSDKLKVSDQVREILDNCGQSRYEIAQGTGIDQAALSKFMHGERGLSCKALDTLGQYLGLRIIVEKRPAGRKG